jgi:phytoene synthase
MIGTGTVDVALAPRGPGSPSETRGGRTQREAVQEATERVRGNLTRLAGRLAEAGLPRPALDGKILRPLVAYLTVPEKLRPDLDDRFWWGALAVEMVHEASLLHDDILDEAPERRGKPTLSAAAGIGPALVLGDHLLTASYRAAAATESPRFLQIFIRAVERTVAGEIAQERAQGRILAEAEYRRIITGKSGELFRSVFSLAPCLLGIGSPEAVGAIGAHLGCLYQMVDDFLDYCPGADRGKVPLQDFRQRKWTWPLGLIDTSHFEVDEGEVLARLFTSVAPGEQSPMEKGVLKMGGEAGAILSGLRAQGLTADLLGTVLDGWIQQLHRSTADEVARFSSRLPRLSVRPRLAERTGPASPEPASGTLEIEAYLASAAAPLANAEPRLSYFGRHARTFRFAARLFPRDALEKVAGVYAFCRFTDDLVDEAEGVAAGILEARLDTWLRLARTAYGNERSGIPFLDEVMGTARRHRVPFDYVEELVKGVRMDVRPRTFETQEALRVYSYRVASVVGGWLTELFGVRDPWVLDRAFALGHAMQLTNILRDVGEDLKAGRLYLPLDRLNRHGVDRDLLEAKAREGSPMFPGYRRLLEDLMAQADADYTAAFQAIPALPGFFQRPVAVAARAYQGIHQEIRKNGYDNLTRRATTSRLRKALLAARALLELSLLKKNTGRRRTVRREAPLPPLKDGREATA